MYTRVCIRRVVLVHGQARACHVHLGRWPLMLRPLPASQGQDPGHRSDRHARVAREELALRCRHTNKQSHLTSRPSPLRIGGPIARTHTHARAVCKLNTGGRTQQRGREEEEEQRHKPVAHTHTHGETGEGGAVQRGVSQHSMRALLACDAAKHIDRMQIETIDRNNNKGFTHSRIWT